MASYLNKRAKVSSEAVTGDGDLVTDVKAGRTSFSAVKDEDLPDNLRAMKPEARMDEVNKQMDQRKALNDKLRRWWPSATNTSPSSARRRRRKRHRSTAWSRTR